jgi:hypothetical protein
MERAKVYQFNHNRNLTGRLTPPETVPAIAPRPKLLDQVRKAIRMRHYSPKTEESYVHWIKRFVFFHNKRHPAEMGEKEIAQFLSSLASELHLSASTQNQALNAVLFLYRDVLHKEIGYINGVVRAKTPHRLPVVLSQSEGSRMPRMDFTSCRVWSWPPTNGMFAAEGQRYRFHEQPNCHSRG